MHGHLVFCQILLGMPQDNSLERILALNLETGGNDRFEKGNPMTIHLAYLHQQAKADPFEGSLGDAMEELAFPPLQPGTPKCGDIDGQSTIPFIAVGLSNAE